MLPLFSNIQSNVEQFFETPCSENLNTTLQLFPSNTSDFDITGEQRKYCIRSNHLFCFSRAISQQPLVR